MAYLDRPDQPRRIGFSSYADGTPRFDPFDDPVPAEEGFDDEDDARLAPAEPPEAANLPEARPRLVAFTVAAVAGAALAFTGAYLIRSSQPPAAAQVPPPSVAPEAAAPAPPPAAAPEAAVQPHPATQGAGPRHLTARLDCARPASHAQRMVCGSPRLLALDRRMSRAYAEAKARGAPPRTLQRDQARWLMARETAARRSRGAVEHLYRSRLAALEAQPYPRCGRADAQSGRPDLASLTHWLLSVPRKVVSPGAGGRSCG